MSNNKKQINKMKVPKNTKDMPAKDNKLIFITIGLIALVFAGFLIVKLVSGGGNAAVASGGGDIKITKSDITETAKFYPYKVGGSNMEVLAVKASDGSIRTAFNTCQVCYNSGKGYYKQEGNELVCQNCGNRFKIDQVEKEKNGCNPVPILDQNKTDDGTIISISKDFLTQNKDLFGNWRKG